MYKKRKINPNPQIRLEETGVLISVPHEIYREYYRDIERERKRKQKAGECVCGVYHISKCTGDYWICEYHRAGKNVSIESTFELNGDVFASNVGNPEGEYERKEQNLALRNAILRLPSKEQAAVLVKHFSDTKDLSLHKSAEKLKLPYSTFRSHYERGKKRLAELMHDWR